PEVLAEGKETQRLLRDRPDAWPLPGPGEDFLAPDQASRRVRDRGRYRRRGAAVGRLEASPDRNRPRRGRRHGESRHRRSSRPPQKDAENPEADYASKKDQQASRLALQEGGLLVPPGRRAVGERVCGGRTPPHVASLGRCAADDARYAPPAPRRRAGARLPRREARLSARRRALRAPGRAGQTARRRTPPPPPRA